jgi:hypothetical protein
MPMTITPDARGILANQDAAVVSCTGGLPIRGSRAP